MFVATVGAPDTVTVALADVEQDPLLIVHRTT